MSWESNVGCPHAVALLAWLRAAWPLRLPTGVPGKRLQWGCWVVVRAVEWTLASLCGPLCMMDHRSIYLVDFLLLLAGSWGERQLLSYTSFETIV